MVVFGRGRATGVAILDMIRNTQNRPWPTTRQGSELSPLHRLNRRLISSSIPLDKVVTAHSDFKDSPATAIHVVVPRPALEPLSTQPPVTLSGQRVGSHRYSLPHRH